MLIPMGFDHPIFSESLRLIEAALPEGALEGLSVPERDVVLRLIHSSGDLSLVRGCRFQLRLANSVSRHSVPRLRC